jgi:transcriptional regulator with XRE-family HTH domain
MEPPRIKDTRKLLDLTQREFAKLLSTSHTTIQRWERGESTPNELQKAILKRLKENPEHPYILLGMAEKDAYGNLMETLFGNENPLMAD